MEQRPVISLDIGGTAGKGMLIHPQADTLVRFQLPSRNFRSMVELELADFLNLVMQSLPGHPVKDGALWCIGAAGARPETDGPRIRQILSDLGVPRPEVRVFQDYRGNWAAAFGGEPGMVSVNGTGAVLFGRLGDREGLRGGLGYLIDETPSGAYFGRSFLRELLLEIEEGGNDLGTIYSTLFSETPPTREHLLGKLYSSKWPQSFLAGYSRAFMEARRRGHPGCIRHADQAIAGLTTQIASLLKTLGTSAPIRFCGIGALWQDCHDFSATLREKLEQSFPGQLQITSPLFPSAVGPYLFFLHQCGVPPQECLSDKFQAELGLVQHEPGTVLQKVL